MWHERLLEIVGPRVVTKSRRTSCYVLGFGPSEPALKGPKWALGKDWKEKVEMTRWRGGIQPGRAV